MIALARKTLAHEWRRFMPAVVAVGFSGVLLAVQVALVLGIFGSAAVSVTASSAELWAGYPGTRSVNYGRPVRADVEMRLRMDPAVAAVEPYLWLEADWQNANHAGAGVPVFVSGVRTEADAMMFSRVIAAGLRAQLAEPGVVVVDRSDLSQLGTRPGQWAWINGQRVRIAAAVDGLRALGGVNVLASLDTARSLGATPASMGATYFVARLDDPDQAEAVRDRIASDPAFGAFQVWTAGQFATRSQLYWMLDTGAGAAVLFMAAIVFLVGVVITSQSLSAVVASSSREYAMLQALGASRVALGRVIVEQALWIGGLGLIVATLATAALLGIASSRGVPVTMNLPAAASCAVLVGAVALLSGVASLRALLRADPSELLR